MKTVSKYPAYSLENKWLVDRQYLYPVKNSEFYNPRDGDYELVENWEFKNKQEFFRDWERLDGIRGNQLMHYRDNDANYGYEKYGEDGFLYLKTLYHDQPVKFEEKWPRPYTLSYEYSTAECITKESYLYGYFEARIKIPEFKGGHAAFWLFSKGYEGNALEIDIMESTSARVPDTRRRIFTTNFSEYNHTRGDLHKQAFVFQDDPANSLSDEFHIYAVEWTPFDLRYYMDNQLLRVDPIPPEYEMFPCFVRLGVEVDHWTPPDKKVLDPMIVDWVRVYQKKEMKSENQRPEIVYDDRVIKAGEWVIASIRKPSPSKNYYWETDGNCTYFTDNKNRLHFKLIPGGARSTIISLTSADIKGPSELNRWKEQVVFTDQLPMNFKLLVYNTKCNEEGKARVTAKSQDLSKYGITSTTFNVYLTNKKGEKKGKPIETMTVPSPGEARFWLNPKTQYWIEHVAEWLDGGPRSIAKIMKYPTLDPTFSPKVYEDIVNGRQRKFVTGSGVNPNQIHRWKLYSTNLNRTSEKFLESYEKTGSKTFCFDLSKYPDREYFFIVHEMEQGNEKKCVPTETRKMYFTSNRYSDKPPSNVGCFD